MDSPKKTVQKSKTEQHGLFNLSISNLLIDVKKYDEGLNEVQELLSQGNTAEAAKKISVLIKGLKSQHPFFPDYRYEPVLYNGKVYFKHVPNSREAIEKYPLRFKGKMKLSEDILKKYGDINNLFKELYLKQKEIKVDMLELNTFIGDTKVDSVLEQLEDVEWFIKPPEKPVTPMQLYSIDNDVILDYLEMSVSDINKDTNSIVISNEGQENAKILFKLYLNLESKKSNFNFRIKKGYFGDTHARLALLKLMSKSLERIPIALKSLKDNKVVLVAQEWTWDEKIPENINKEIEFISFLIKIEHFYNVKFNLPEKYSEEDLEQLQLIKLPIDRKPLKGEITRLSILIDNKDALKNIIKMYSDNGNKGKELQFIGHGKSVELFGCQIDLSNYRFKHTYDNLKVEDLNKLIRKYQDMEEGETIKVEFIPDTNNKVEISVEED